MEKPRFVDLISCFTMSEPEIVLRIEEPPGYAHLSFAKLSEALSGTRTE